MKKTLLLIAILIVTIGTYAQKGKVSNAQTLKDAGKLTEAVAAINEAIDQNNPKAEKSYNWPKAWEVRGDVYRAVFLSTDANVQKLAEDPLKISLESYQKALALDDKGRNKNVVKIALTLLTESFTNQAVRHFETSSFDKAFESFKNIITIQNMPLMVEEGQPIDTAIIYNAGLAAFQGGLYEDAIIYYKEAAKYGFFGAKLYEMIYHSYMSLNDTIEALNTLQEGLEKYPDSSDILVGLVRIYIATKEPELASKYLNKAIEQDPTNPMYYFAQGDQYDKLGMPEDAVISSYKKAIELKPDFFDPYYNIAVYYYNRGVKQYEFAFTIPTNQMEKFEIEKSKADDDFQKAIPYMEKASEINPEDITALETLKNIYYRLKMMDKYDEATKKVDDLK